MKEGGLVTRVTVLLALAALVVGGGFPGALALGAAAALFWRGPRLPGNAWIALHVAVAGGSAALVVQGQPREALALLVSWLLVHRAWTGTGAADARLALLFATLLALLACLRSESMLLGSLLVGFCAALPAALLRVQVGDVPGQARRGALAAGLVVVLGAGMFVLLPRLRGGYFERGGGAGGAGSTVVLGDEGDDAGGDALVARVLVTGPDGFARPGPIYLQGRVLDRFDGRVWSSTVNTPGRVRSSRPAVPGVPGWAEAPAGADLRAEVELEPAPGGVIFGLSPVLLVDGVASPTWRDRNGGWHHQAGVSRLHYVAWSRQGPQVEGRALTHLDAWLQLPALDPRVAALAASIAPDVSDPRQLAQELTHHLSNEYLYVETPPAPGADPLADFLFVTKRGHCEYFASALAVLLRARGVPARLATGYLATERDFDGRHLLVRGADAHAWVEVPLPSGPARFDPSPLGGEDAAQSQTWTAWVAGVHDWWMRNVVEYDLGDQVTGLDELGRRAAAWTGTSPGSSPTGAGFGVVVVVLAAVYTFAATAQLAGGRLLVVPRSAPPDRLARLATDARRLAARRGWEIPAALPLADAGRWLAEEAGVGGAAFGELAEVVYRARYGGADPALAEREGRALLGRLRRELPRRPRGPAPD